MADASALVDYLLGTNQSPAIGNIVPAPETEFHAPALCDIEVTAAPEPEV